LANRAIEAGQDASEVLLNARVWREVDGVSVSDARQRAAIKNIAEGTGSALDAAKVLRELGDDGLMRMPPLPPNSALVRDAGGLSNLGDDAFRAVINGVVDERFGAIVGAMVKAPDEQMAIIHALSIHKPSNVNQAQIMVQDMRAAGFQKTETEDLFGGQTLTETLFKERARVIDHAMKQIKRDKQVFTVLTDQGKRIESAGNVLNRDENLIRVSEGDVAMTALSKLANTKGEVSTAIQSAAERLKSGESIQKAGSELLEAIRRSAAGEQKRVLEDAPPKQTSLIEQDIDSLDLGIDDKITADIDAANRILEVQEEYITTVDEYGNEVLRPASEILAKLDGDSLTIERILECGKQ
jgi:hypothetical protein